MTALSAMAGTNSADPYSRERPLAQLGAFPAHLRLGVPRSGQLIFFGDKAAEAAYGEALKRWTALGATLVEFDLEPLYETARLLYEGPWVAERYLVIRDLLASSPDAIHPVTREITIAGAGFPPPTPSRRCTGCKACARRPSAPSPASTRWCCRRRRRCIRPRRCWPIRSSSIRRLGTYTNFVNLLDLAASHCRRRCAGQYPVRHYAARARRAGRAAREHRPRLSCRHQTADGREKLPQPPLASCPRACPATRSPSRWSARIFRAWR